MVRPVRFGGRFRLAGRALAARSASGAVFFSLLLGAAVLVCRPAVAAIPPDSAFSFEATPEFEGGVMPYRLFKAVGHDLPENAAKTYPLIIWLHGLGERKTPPDNTSQLKSYAKNLVSTANQAYEPAFLMVPQVDTATGNWAGETNPAVVKAETRLLLGIEDLKARFRIDPDRIYVMGLSFGGGGTWNLGIRHPGYFAAIAPMSQGAGAGAEQLGLLAHMPVWAFDGAADNAAGSTLSAVNGVRNAGGRVMRTLYDSPAAHSSLTWGSASADPDFYKWLVAQRRLQETLHPPWIRIESPSATRSYATPDSSVLLSGAVGLPAATMTGVNAITWNSDGGGGGAAAGTSPWTAGPVTAGAASQLVQVLATAQNHATHTYPGVCVFNDSIMIHDAEPPSLAVLNPGPGLDFVSPADRLTVRGSASDNRAVTRIAWSNDRGGSGVAGAEINNLVPGQVNWFISGIPLQAGFNRITITARDLSGNSSARQIRVYRAAAGGGDFFRQDFDASSSLADYQSTSLNPPANTFYDIDAKALGGTWSLVDGALQLARAGGGSSADWTAGVFRRYALEGPPDGVIAASFDLSVSAGTLSGTFAKFGFGLFLASTSATTVSGAHSDLNTDLLFNGVSGSRFTLKVSGTTASAHFNCDGTVYRFSWFVNASGAPQSYVDLNGVLRTVDDNGSDVWVGPPGGAVRVIANAVRTATYRSRRLGHFRFVAQGADPLTLRLDNLVLQDFTRAADYAGWRARVFVAGELLDPEVSGDEADPDGDGLGNLLEYALGGHPRHADAACAPALVFEAGQVRLKWHRAAADVTCIVESSSDLVTWTPLAVRPAGGGWTGPAAVAETGNGPLYAVTVTDPAGWAGQARRFLRLRVTYP